jgi:hypothetical protein
MKSHTQHRAFVSRQGVDSFPTPTQVKWESEDDVMEVEPAGACAEPRDSKSE